LHLEYIVQVDAKGWIPAWVANLVASSQAFNVEKIKIYFENKINGKEEVTEEAKTSSEESKTSDRNSENESQLSTSSHPNDEKQKKKKKKQQKQKNTGKEEA